MYYVFTWRMNSEDTLDPHRWLVTLNLIMGPVFSRNPLIFPQPSLQYSPHTCSQLGPQDGLFELDEDDSDEDLDLDSDEEVKDVDKEKVSLYYKSYCNPMPYINREARLQLTLRDLKTMFTNKQYFQFYHQYIF